MTQTNQTKGMESKPKILNFLRETEIHSVDGFLEKARALISILTPQEKEALFKRMEKQDFSPVVGNEGLVLMLLQSLYMQETDEGKACYEAIRSKRDQAYQEKKPQEDEKIKTLRQHLPQIKAWLDKATYQEKLTVVLCWQLINKEHLFKKPDNRIGNKYYSQFEDDILAAQRNPQYLEKAEPEETVLTSLVMMMLDWEV